MNDRALNIKIPEELYNDLKEAAKSQNISMASLVRLLCTDYIEARKNPMRGMPEEIQRMFGYIADSDGSDKPKK